MLGLDLIDLAVGLLIACVVDLKTVRVPKESLELVQKSLLSVDKPGHLTILTE
jgi:hypothetical protein